MVASSRGTVGRRAGSIGARLVAATLVVALLGGCGATAVSVSPAQTSGSAGPPATAILSPGVGQSLPAPFDACATGLASGTSRIRFEADGQDRQALLHIPTTPPPERGYPVLVALPGYSTSAPEFERYSGLSDKADRSGFVVVYPEALGDPREWHLAGAMSFHPEFTRSDHEFIGELVDWLGSSRCVDAGRVFLVGHSQGGGMAADLSCELGERLAGIGLVSGLYLSLPCQAPRPIPMVAFHALDDPVLPYAGGTVAGAPADYPQVLPVDDVLDQWAVHDQCTGDPVVSRLEAGAGRDADSRPDADGGPSAGSLLTWRDCSAPVLFYRLTSGGHQWTPETPDRLWAFFEAVPSTD